MARILFLTELLPYPLVTGAKIRAYYVLRHLAQRHEVTLVSFVREDDREEHVAHLQTFLDQIHTVPMQRSRLRDARAVLVSLLSGRPAIIAREDIRSMRRQVEALLSSGGFDVVHADQIPMAQYGLLGREAAAKRLLDQHNASFQIIERLAHQERNRLKRLALRREARAFARYEGAICQQYDYVTFVTEEDRRMLLTQMPGGTLDGRSAVIPICVDTAAVEPVQPVPAPFRIAHVGIMYWPPNVEGVRWFQEEVWPRVRAEAPRACLTVIGKNPPEEVCAWDQQADVEVPGYVEDLAPYLAETAAFVVPLHAGGGMRVKIVDAWCWGLPVVSTTIGCEGIDVRDGENILVADSPGAFAEAVVQVLGSAELQARLRANGRRRVEERYDWRRVYGAWDEVYGRLFQA